MLYYCFKFIVERMWLLIIFVVGVVSWFFYEKFKKKGLAGCKQSFKKPFEQDYNFGDKSVYVINSEKVAKEASKELWRKDVLYVDCEGNCFGGNNAELALIQIATDENNCYIFDVKTCKEILFILRDIFESESIQKVFHDCSGDGAALQDATYLVTDLKDFFGKLGSKEMGMSVKNVFDTQVAHRFITKRRLPISLGILYEHCNKGKVFPEIEVSSYGRNKWIEQRPLTEEMIKYAALDALVLPSIHKAQCPHISKRMMGAYERSVERHMSSKTKNVGYVTRLWRHVKYYLQLFQFQIVVVLAVIWYFYD